jgi:hypothetical protein
MAEKQTSREGKVNEVSRKPLQAHLYDFNVGGSVLKRAHVQWLDTMVVEPIRIVGGTPAGVWHVWIFGNASTTGARADNLRLAEQRAHAVVRHLGPKLLGKPHKLHVIATGEEHAARSGLGDGVELDFFRSVSIVVGFHTAPPSRPPRPSFPATGKRKDLRFYFISQRTNSIDKVLKHEMLIISDAIPVQNVRQLTHRVLDEVESTGGRIKTIVFSSHGVPNWFRIGDDQITPETLRALHWPHLIALTPHFHRNATVFVAGCDVAGTIGQHTLLRQLSKLWGGVRVVGWKEKIEVVDGWFRDYIAYPSERVVCKMDGCTTEGTGMPRHDNKPPEYSE